MAKAKNVKEAKVEEKETKKNKVKEEKVVVKSESKGGTIAELKKVVWPSFGDVMKYTLAVIIMCLIVCGLFQLVTILVSLIKGVL